MGLSAGSVSFNQIEVLGEPGASSRQDRGGNPDCQRGWPLGGRGCGAENYSFKLQQV